MTDAELDELETLLRDRRQAKSAREHEEADIAIEIWLNTMAPALIAEVRRLRKDNAVLAKWGNNPWEPALTRNYADERPTDDVRCRSCNAVTEATWDVKRGHNPSCEWLAAYERATGVEQKQPETPEPSTPEHLPTIDGKPACRYAGKIIGSLDRAVKCAGCEEARQAMLKNRASKKLTQEDIDRVLGKPEVTHKGMREWYDGHTKRQFVMLDDKECRRRESWTQWEIIAVETVADLEAHAQWLRGGK